MKNINLADNIYKYAAELLQTNKLEGHVIEEIQVGDYVYEASLTFDPITITANKEKNIRSPQLSITRESTDKIFIISVKPSAWTA